MAFPASPTTLDDFNRSNAADLGSNWSEAQLGAGRQVLDSNLAKSPANTVWGFDYADLLICGQDTGGAGNDGYLLEIESISGTDNWYIYKITNGTPTQIGATFTQAITPGTSHAGLVRNGNDIEAYHSSDGSSWTLLATRTDSAYGTGNIGLGSTRFTADDNKRVAWDDYRGGTISAGAELRPISYVKQQAVMRAANF